MRLGEEEVPKKKKVLSIEQLLALALKSTDPKCTSLFDLMLN